MTKYVNDTVNLVDLVKSFPTSIYLQKSASIQPRTSPSKFGGKFNSLFTSLLRCGNRHPDRGAWWENPEDPNSATPIQSKYLSGRPIQPLCEGVLVVLDAKAMPFTRIWCAFEVAIAVTVDDAVRPGKGRLLLDIATVPYSQYFFETDGLASEHARLGHGSAELLTDGLS